MYPRETEKVVQLQRQISLRHPIDSFEDALQQARMAEGVGGQLMSRHTEVGGTFSESSDS